MAKFIYRLQNVLDVKLKLESQEKTNFSMAMARLIEEEKKLDELYDLLSEREEEYRRRSNGRLNIHDLKFAKENVDYTQNVIEAQKLEINKARKAMENARNRLNEAMKDRKIHEKLKEKAFEAFMHEENEAEKKEIDQLVSFRYNDNGKEGA
jgi:flagellar FliJ protein